METQNYIHTLIMFQGILMCIDAYFLMNWTRLAKERRWHPLSYRLAWFVSGILFIFLFSQLIQRLDGAETSELDYYLFVAANIWIIPKLIIVPALLFKNSIHGIVRKASKIFRRKGESQSEDENALAAIAHPSRRKFLQNVGWVAAGIPFAATAYGAINTIYDYKVYRIDVPIWNLPPSMDGLKIVQLSDVHSGSFPSKSTFFEIVRMVNSLNPDFIVITGDFVNNNYRELELTRDGFAAMKAKYAVLGSLGNHDHYTGEHGHEQLKQILMYSNVGLLVNESRSFEINGETIQFCGVDCDISRRTFMDLDAAMAKLRPEKPTVLLCHDPREWDKKIRGHGIPLVLSGHTHGGQIGIEAGDNVISPVKLIYKQFAGLYQSGNEYLYVNRGVGTVGPPVRIGINPEIALITLKSGLISNQPKDTIIDNRN
mgnify:CR=1 FL=1